MRYRNLRPSARLDYMYFSPALLISSYLSLPEHKILFASVFGLKSGIKTATVGTEDGGDGISLKFEVLAPLEPTSLGLASSAEFLQTPQTKAHVASYSTWLLTPL